MEFIPKKFFLVPVILGVLLSSTVLASKSYVSSKRWIPSEKRYYNTISKLVDAGLYFTAVPYMKNFLIANKYPTTRRMDLLIDRIVTAVGVRQFEALPISVLGRSKAPTVRYVLAKKYFRLGKYKLALRQIRARVDGRHPLKPFVLMLQASLLTLMNRHAEAVMVFTDCIESSNLALNNENRPNHIRQLAINRDYCIVGVPRAQFAAKKHKKANTNYLDLSKNSYIWPEILFEEAWNSFYLKDYNRTLGKLVTYKSPILSYIFNPEVYVLEALSYFELCLWEDARRTVDGFYKKYQRPANKLKNFLRKYGRNYKFYYSLARHHRRGEFKEGNFVDRKGYAKDDFFENLMEYILRDPTFIELTDSLLLGKSEARTINRTQGQKRSRMLEGNLKEALRFQKEIIGMYVRKSLHLFNDKLEQAFEGMSHIKLEVLNKRKEMLYSNRKEKSRIRGDKKYVKRNDKQYFWTFNGEFWADELGDYVFALRSECKK